MELIIVCLLLIIIILTGMVITPKEDKLARKAIEELGKEFNKEVYFYKRSDHVKIYKLDHFKTFGPELENSLCRFQKVLDSHRDSMNELAKYQGLAFSTKITKRRNASEKVVVKKIKKPNKK